MASLINLIPKHFLVEYELIKIDGKISALHSYPECPIYEYECKELFDFLNINKENYRYNSNFFPLYDEHCKVDNAIVSLWVHFLNYNDPDLVLLKMMQTKNL
jgi:hypothetical protein